MTDLSLTERTNENSPKRRNFLLAGVILLNVALASLVIGLAVTKLQKRRQPVQGFAAIVATVNGRPIYARDLFSAGGTATPDLSGLRSTLGRMIREEVVAQEADSLPINAVTLDQLLKNVGCQFTDSDQERSALRSAGVSKSVLRERFVRQLQIARWLQDRAASQPTDAECRAWFEANPELSVLPEVVQASHFAAIFPPRGTPGEFLEKGDLLRDAQSRLRDGIPFQQLIDALSDDPAKKITGGSLFWFRRERMEPALAEAAFAQPLSEISPAVETRFGFHLLQVTAHQPERILTYEQVAGEIRQRLQAEQERRAIATLVTSLLQRAKVQILDPQLDTPIL